MQINSVNVDKMPLKRHILLDFSSRKKPPWLNKFVPVFWLGKCASAKASCAMLVPRVFSLQSRFPVWNRNNECSQITGEYRREKVTKMALNRALWRFITPGNNILLLCRAQSSANAAIGILFYETLFSSHHCRGFSIVYKNLLTPM